MSSNITPPDIYIPPDTANTTVYLPPGNTFSPSDSPVLFGFGDFSLPEFSFSFELPPLEDFTPSEFPFSPPSLEALVPPGFSSSLFSPPNNPPIFIRGGRFATLLSEISASVESLAVGDFELSATSAVEVEPAVVPLPPGNPASVESLPLTDAIRALSTFPPGFSADRSQTLTGAEFTPPADGLNGTTVGRPLAWLVLARIALGDRVTASPAVEAVETVETVEDSVVFLYNLGSDSVSRSPVLSQIESTVLERRPFLEEFIDGFAQGSDSYISGES